MTHTEAHELLQCGDGVLEDSLQPIHPTVMGPPVRMVTVVGQDGDAVAFPEATAEWMIKDGVAKEDR